VIGPARTRADRLRLLRRIAVAEHAAELLQSKEEALERERDRLEGYARRADEEWRDAASAAARALVRARLMGAADELGAHVPASVPAVVRPDWQVSMGVTYPGSVGVEPGASVPLVSTAALGPAVDRYRDALSAAARRSATATAVRRLDAELVATRRRRRALEDRLVPSLRHASHELDLHLDELDRDEATRVRIAGGGQAW
jgi:V/A-type H+-transporting ATPase subunit D